MRVTNSYGRYLIEANYKNEHITASTTDSEAYDWYNDDSNKSKHRDAVRHCYHRIRDEYNRTH